MWALGGKEGGRRGERDGDVDAWKSVEDKIREC